MPEGQTLCYLWSASWRILLFHRRAALKTEPAICRPRYAQAMRRIRLTDLPVSEWTKKGILQPANRTQRRYCYEGGDGSSARHDVYYEDVHKEGPSGQRKWKDDDSGRALDWCEGVGGV